MVSVSSTSLVVRYVTVVPALTLAFWRMLSASGMLWGYSIAFSEGSLSSTNKKLTVFSGLFLGLHFAFFFLGVRHTSIANATLLGNTGPFFTTLFALYSGQHISKKTYLGLGLAILGVLIVQGSSLNMGGENIWGNSISILSGFCAGLSYVFSAKIREETRNTVYGRSLFFVAAVTIGIVAVFMGDSLLIRDELSPLEGDLLRVRGIEPDTLPTAIDARMAGVVTVSYTHLTLPTNREV